MIQRLPTGPKRAVVGLREPSPGATPIDSVPTRQYSPCDGSGLYHGSGGWIRAYAGAGGGQSASVTTNPALAVRVAYVFGRGGCESADYPQTPHPKRLAVQLWRVVPYFILWWRTDRHTGYAGCDLAGTLLIRGDFGVVKPAGKDCGFHRTNMPEQATAPNTQADSR